MKNGIIVEQKAYIILMHLVYICGFPKTGDPQNHGFQSVSVLKWSNDWDDLGVPPIQRNLHKDWMGGRLALLHDRRQTLQQLWQSFLAGPGSCCPASRMNMKITIDTLIRYDQIWSDHKNTLRLVEIHWKILKNTLKYHWWILIDSLSHNFDLGSFHWRIGGI